jgi:DNA helicase II / ATP-dependent DNA helicase PcrA
MSIQFTEEQTAVINHAIPGHARVLAGPGTGKSATAAGLAERLLSGDRPLRLKFLTFTRAATLELEKKLAVHGKAKPSTVHSFAIATLLRNPRSAAFPEPLRIVDGYELRQLVRPHLAQCLGIGVRVVDDLIREMAARWESLNPEELPGVDRNLRARFIGAYTQHRNVFGYTLLHELPDLLRCALRDHEDLDGVEYDLLVVDEYQDLNACELELLRRFADRGVSIVAIGDDDQSIYSFRKAHPAGIRRFCDEFRGAQDYVVSICQRLPTRIANWAQHVIAGNVHRAKPPIRCRVGAPEGTVGLLNFPSEVTEARGVADLIQWLRDARQVPLSEILVLCRTDHNGTFTQRIKDELEGRDIAVFDSSSVSQIICERSNRALLAMLRLKVNSADSLAWWTLLHLERGLGRQFEAVIYDDACARGVTFAEALIAQAHAEFRGLAAGLRERGLQFVDRVNRSADGLALPEVTDETKWSEWIIEASIANHLPITASLQALLTKIDESYEDAGEGLGRYLSHLQPLAEDLARAQSEGVRFMTMVGSKGLTVRATVVVGADNDLIPRVGQDINEERRLLYVAMTRSTEYLFLTWANRRQGPGGRAGHANPGRRTFTELLRAGPVDSHNGPAFIRDMQ